MTIWQQRIVEVRKTARMMKQEADRLKERSGTYRFFQAGEVGEILFAWADEIKAIVGVDQMLDAYERAWKEAALGGPDPDHS